MQNLPSIKHMRIPNDRFCSFHIKQKAMGMVPSNSKVYGLTITIPSFFFEKGDKYEHCFIKRTFFKRNLNKKKKQSIAVS